MLVEFKILLSVRPFIKKLRDGQSSASAPMPLVLGCSGINLSALFPMFGSIKGGAQPNEQGNRTIMREHSHLAIEFYNFKFR